MARADKAQQSPQERRQAFLDRAIKKAGLENAQCPNVEEVLGKSMEVRTVKISDLAIFSEEPDASERDSELLMMVYRKCNRKNIVHKNAPITARRVGEVGVGVLKHGRMHHQIEVSELTDRRASLQVTSGRQQREVERRIAKAYEDGQKKGQKPGQCIDE